MIELGNTAAAPAARTHELHPDFPPHALMDTQIGRVQLIAELLQLPAQTGERVRVNIIIIIEALQLLHLAPDLIVQILYAGALFLKNDARPPPLIGRKPGQPTLRARPVQQSPHTAPPIAGAAPMIVQTARAAMPARVCQGNGDKGKNKQEGGGLAGVHHDISNGRTQRFSLRGGAGGTENSDAAQQWRQRGSHMFKAKFMPSRQYGDRKSKAGYTASMSVFSRLRRREGGHISTASAPPRRPPLDAPSAPVGLLLGSAAFVLIVMVTALAIFSIERNDTAMARLLAEKGSSLITAFESILRTTMRSEAGVRLQVLLEEMTVSRDIQFIAVTMPDGTIVAHSNPDRLGEILMLDGEEISPERLRAMSPGMDAQWGIMVMEGRRVFVVYRVFMPSPGLAASGLPAPAIFLGLDISPFDITRRQDRDYVVMLAGVMLLVGLTILVALYYAQRARLSRLRQRRAEGQVRLLEEEVRRREKLATIGTLAAGVAHEIRNPLSSIKGYATYFGQRFGEGSDDRKAAEVMVREVERLNRVITDLIGLSRPSDVRPKAAALAGTVAHVLRLIKQDAEKRGVRIVCHVPDSLPPAWMDPDRFGQALLNICLNALDAMPDGGTLRLAARAVPAGSGQAPAGGTAPLWLALAVEDTGKGIGPEQLRHIFDPYFTTKGHGTGLGLATAHKIMEALGGKIDVISTPAGADASGVSGACFTLWLPSPPRHAAPATERTPS